MEEGQNIRARPPLPPLSVQNFKSVKRGDLGSHRQPLRLHMQGVAEPGKMNFPLIFGQIARLLTTSFALFYISLLYG